MSEHTTTQDDVLHALANDPSLIIDLRESDVVNRPDRQFVWWPVIILIVLSPVTYGVSWLVGTLVGVYK